MWLNLCKGSPISKCPALTKPKEKSDRLQKNKNKSMAEVGKEYSFDITKTDEIFDRLLKDEQLKLEDGHVLSSAEEVMGKKDCKWYNSWSH